MRAGMELIMGWLVGFRVAARAGDCSFAGRVCLAANRLDKSGMSLLAG